MKKLFVVLAVLALVAAPSFAQYDVGGTTASGTVTANVAMNARIDKIEPATNQSMWIFIGLGNAQNFTPLVFEIDGETGKTIKVTWTFAEAGSGVNWTYSASTNPANAGWPGTTLAHSTLSGALLLTAGHHYLQVKANAEGTAAGSSTSTITATISDYTL